MGQSWATEIDSIRERLKSETLESIGKSYDVSRQRMYQVLTKFGVPTPDRTRRNCLKERNCPKSYWLSKVLQTKRLSKEERGLLVDSLELPDLCPVFGVALVYGNDRILGTNHRRLSKGSKDNNASLDRIDSSLGYCVGNVQVISLRANRIKNDSTPEELRKLADFMDRLTKK